MVHEQSGSKSLSVSGSNCHLVNITTGLFCAFHDIPLIQTQPDYYFDDPDCA